MAADTIKPWLRGIIDTLVGAELLRGSAIPHRNRLAVILIDSGFETACRAFLQYKAKIKLSDSHKHRDTLISTMKSKLPDIDANVWDNINYYYEEIRCDFYHESAGKTVIDTSLLDYRDTVEFVIDTAFGMKVRPMVEAGLVEAQVTAAAEENPDTVPTPAVHVADTRDKTEKVLIAVATAATKGVDDVNAFFKREGESLRLKPEEFTSILARNSGSKKLFYFDRTDRCWKVSKRGNNKLAELKDGDSNG